MGTEYYLPRRIDKVVVPPIKCQGIKTKLVRFIAEKIYWEGKGKWIEPFLGSGVVAFNIRPNRAYLTDSNIHIIRFYQDIQSGTIDEYDVRAFLEFHGVELSKRGKEYYYDIRKQFNEKPDSLKFLFLNRSCFNGLMRFNSKGKYNVPFGHKPNRFQKAYITKITNQVAGIRKILQDADWTFEVSGYHQTINKATEDDFIYLDPPYIGRNTDYYNNWSDKDSFLLSELAHETEAGLALSMWKQNKYRYNHYLDNYWGDFREETFKHFYHVGSKKKLRNEIIEALMIKPGYIANNKEILFSEDILFPISSS